MKNEKNATFAERLNAALDARKMKQTELAAATDIPKSMIHHYLKGSYEPKHKRMFVLAQALNVSEIWLQGYDVPMEKTLDDKKNDDLVEIVARLRNDNNFFEMCNSMNKMSAEQLAGLQSLIAAFSNK